MLLIAFSLLKFASANGLLKINVTKTVNKTRNTNFLSIIVNTAEVRDTEITKETEQNIDITR